MKRFAVPALVFVGVVSLASMAVGLGLWEADRKRAAAARVPAPIASPPAKAPSALTHTTSFVVFPADANAHGTLFGGKLLSEMDRTAAIAVRRALYASPTKGLRGVTAGVSEVKFLKPATTGDLLFTTAAVASFGEKSVAVNAAVMREDDRAQLELLATATFTFVAYDPAAKKAVPHGLKLEGRK